MPFFSQWLQSPRLSIFENCWRSVFRISPSRRQRVCSLVYLFLINPLVIVDLVLNSPEELRKIPQTNWYRLQRLVELVPTACLVFTRYEMVGSAQLRLVLENSWNLETLEKQNAISQLRIVVKRSHAKSVVN